MSWCLLHAGHMPQDISRDPRYITLKAGLPDTAHALTALLAETPACWKLGNNTSRGQAVRFFRDGVLQHGFFTGENSAGRTYEVKLAGQQAWIYLLKDWAEYLKLA